MGDFNAIVDKELDYKNVSKEYIRKIELPKLPEKYQKLLNQKVTITEVIEAIKQQKNDKICGLDDLPAEIYKSFEAIFGTLLKDICNEALLNGKIPTTWTKANITLIPKEDMDVAQIQNYQPISLLNVDYKIFASILAERLKKLLIDFIHPDQNGFLPKRQMKNNLRTILDILEYYEIHTKKPMALLFMDAQKAFDNVNWQFMKQQMIQMEFGEKFINAISSISQKQSARILIKGKLSNPIEIQKGTRQGYPLSPLLFILILEVLNRSVRDDEDIKGTRIRDESYKLQGFADDLVFIMEEPFVTMPKLLQRIEEYGEVTGMKINREKTKLLIKNLTQEQKERVQEQVDLQIAKKIFLFLPYPAYILLRALVLESTEERREATGKGERERYTQLNAEFQRIARRDKNAFFNEQCKEIEENSRIGRIRDLFKKIGDMKGTFHAKMGMIKDQNGRDLTEAEEIKKRWQDYPEELYKKELNVPDNYGGVVADLQADILDCEVKWA
ncbi:hypothetical protein EYD10_18021 [Varanus komodoensis]|nr:hypothetical protein EYD10_18021 [Varanus komodoensis]